MIHLKLAIPRWFVTGLSIGLLVGCGAESPSSEQAADAGTSQPAPADTASPSDGTTGSGVGQYTACDTPSHFAEVTWENGQPYLSFTNKPNNTVLNKANPVAILGNPDNSYTYGVQAESTFYVRVYPNGECLLQSLNAQQQVVVEEYGRVSTTPAEGAS